MANLFEGMEKPFLPMLISNWIVGIGVIEYPLRKPRKLFSFVYTSVILCSFLYMSYVSYSYYAVTKLSKLNPTTNGMFYYTNTLVTVSVLVAGWFQSKGLHECILNAAVSNVLLQKIGIQKSYSKILKTELFRFFTLFAYIIAVITVNCALTVYDKRLKVEQIIAIFLHNFPIIVVFIADSSFMNILGYAYYKFESLNSMFTNLLTSTENVPLYREIAKQISTTNVRSRDNYDAEEKDYTFVVKMGKLVHLQLTKLCREANKTYGFHMLISIAVAFIMMINNTFNVYLSLRCTSFSNTQIKEIVRSLNWFLYFWVKTTTNSRFYTTVCNSVNVNNVQYLFDQPFFCTVFMSYIALLDFQANKTGDIICELYDEHSVNASTKAEIRRFNIELIQNKLKLSACGFVNIDLTLIPNMVAAIGTYLIIIIQLQKVDYVPSMDDNDDY